MNGRGIKAKVNFFILVFNNLGTLVIFKSPAVEGSHRDIKQ